MIKSKYVMLIGLSLFATGCAMGAAPRKIKSNPPVPEPGPEPESEPAPVERMRYGVSFSVDPKDERLTTAFTTAAAAWNKALGGEWVTIKENGEVAVFWVETVEGEGCPTIDVPTGKYVSGCAAATGTLDTHVELSTKIPDDERLRGIVLHEMGHVIRGTRGHIDTEGSGFPFNENNVMNHTGNPTTMITPTADDAAFVWQGMRYDYSQNLPQQGS